jgi:AcrR family transcriptional regulator
LKEGPTRPYNAPRRKERAEATRRSIVQAARSLFARNGYQATTLQAIAREAGVALPTVYAVFGSKAAILSALVKSAGADEDIREMARVAFAESDPAGRLRAAAHVIRSIHQRETDLEELLWQAGGGDPDLAAVWRQGHHQRLTRLGELVSTVAKQGALKPGLTPETATEIQWALSSPEIYRLLVYERGWTPQRYEDWLAESTTALLLNPA